METKIIKGMSTTFKREVRSSDTSASFGGGVLEYLLSTPAIISMAIETSMKLLNPCLPSGYITVSSQVDVTHLKPTLIGEPIEMVLTVDDFNGHIVRCSFTVSDHIGLIAKGSHTRSVVEANDLIHMAYARLGKDI